MIILNSTFPELVLPEADPVSMYIIVNADLQLSPAKLAVQVAHGVELYLEHFWKIYLGIIEETRTDWSVIHHQWINSGSRKIVLKANPAQWNKIRECDEIEGYLVIDAGLSEIPFGSETCIIFPPMKKSLCHKFVKKLQLL